LDRRLDLSINKTVTYTEEQITRRFLPEYTASLTRKLGKDYGQGERLLCG
jgi:hypothetical protein